MPLKGKLGYSWAPGPGSLSAWGSARVGRRQQGAIGRPRPQPQLGFPRKRLRTGQLSHASGLWAKAWSLAAQVIQGRDGGPACEREGGGGGVESGWPVGERCAPGPALCLLEELGPVLVSLPRGQRPQRHQVSSDTQSVKCAHPSPSPCLPFPRRPSPQSQEEGAAQQGGQEEEEEEGVRRRGL